MKELERARTSPDRKGAMGITTYCKLYIASLPHSMSVPWRYTLQVFVGGIVPLLWGYIQVLAGMDAFCEVFPVSTVPFTVPSLGVRKDPGQEGPLLPWFWPQTHHPSVEDSCTSTAGQLNEAAHSWPQPCVNQGQSLQSQKFLLCSHAASPRLSLWEWGVASLISFPEPAHWACWKDAATPAGGYGGCLGSVGGWCRCGFKIENVHEFVTQQIHFFGISHKPFWAYEGKCKNIYCNIFAIAKNWKQSTCPSI